MTLQPLQPPLDRLTDYLSDADRIHEVVNERNQQLADQRRKRGNKTGGGAPPAVHRALNRAVVVAAVGSWEAFCEDLALSALDHDPRARPPCAWYKIDGTRGMVQTPNSDNVRRLLWTYFRYDPVLDWNIRVWTSPNESGSTGSSWRVASNSYEGADAANFLDTMVTVRHGFAHQDVYAIKNARPGIVTRTRGGKFAVHSHHAWNARSVLVQLAVQTTCGLSDALGQSRTFRWSRRMSAAGWDELLADTPAGATVSAEWERAPQL